jgi:kynurenine formamidase
MPEAGPAPDGAAGGRSDLPRDDELPAAGRGDRSARSPLRATGSVGLLNLQPDASALAAASLVRKGSVFSLNAELDDADPPLGPARAISANVVFYNGATDDEALIGHRNTIEHWARRGIAGRGVLLDLGRALNEGGRSYTPDGAADFSVADLEYARSRAGIDFSPGCIVLLRTGFLGWYCGRPRPQRRRLAAGLRAPGIEHTGEMARYLRDSQIMAVASDTFAAEAWPRGWGTDDAPFGFLHRVLTGQFGMALGGLWWLDDLAADCDQDGVHEFFLTSAPLNAPGGIGSPPTALAIK